MQTHVGNRSWQPFCGRKGAEATLQSDLQAATAAARSRAAMEL